MITDYSHRYTSIALKNRQYMRQNVPAGTFRGLTDHWVMKRAVGVLMVIVLLAGFGTAFWFGRQIRLALYEIGNNENIRQEMTAINKKLKAERHQLLSREHIIAAAGKIGLYKPAARQIRRL